MRTKAVFVLSLYILFNIASVAVSQSERLSSWPQRLLGMCYYNLTNFDPSTRSPMTMQNLIGLIRKYELSNGGNMDLATNAAMLIHKYRVDGMYYDPTADPFKGRMPLHPVGYDFQKSQMIKDMIPRPSTSFQNIFTQAEECSLYWMLSYNVNLTRSGFSESCTPPNYQRMKRNQRLIRASPTTDPNLSMCPIEAGVVYTPWGSVAAGNVIAALATFNNLQPFYRGADNLYTASLGGELAEYAILEETLDDGLRPIIGSRGWWHATNAYGLAIPRDYHLNTQVYSHLSLARIRGAIDGLLLGLKLREWNQGTTFTLSQVLDMYYSEIGMNRDPSIRSCDRFANLQKIDDNPLMESGVSFMDPLNTNYSNIVGGNASRNLFKDSLRAMKAFVTAYQIPTQEKCTHDVNSPGNNDPVYAPNIDLYAVMDFSAYSFDDQRNLLASLAQNLDISPWTSKMSVISTQNNSYIMPFNYSSNGAEIAERIYDLYYQKTTSKSFLDTLQFLYDEIRLDEQRVTKYNGANTKVILFMATGDVYPPADKTRINRMIWNFRMYLPETRILFYTSRPDYNDFVMDVNRDILSPSKYSPPGPAGRTIAMEVMAQIPRRLFYRQCDTKYNESTYTFADSVSPMSANLYRYHPINFYTSDSMTITFTGKSTGLKVCTSRVKPLAFEGNPNKCKESLEANVNLDFSFVNLCDGDDWTRCKPIYFSVQQVASNTATGDNICQDTKHPDLRIKCRFPTQATFVVTHKGMECGISNWTTITQTWSTGTTGLTKTTPGTEPTTGDYIDIDVDIDIDMHLHVRAKFDRN